MMGGKFPIPTSVVAVSPFSVYSVTFRLLWGSPVNSVQATMDAQTFAPTTAGTRLGTELLVAITDVPV